MLKYIKQRDETTFGKIEKISRNRKFINIILPVEKFYLWFFLICGPKYHKKRVRPAKNFTGCQLIILIIY